MNEKMCNSVVMLKLSWLGPPVIEYDGRPLRLEMRKTLALLAYLSLSSQTPTRETLASLFWPEHDQQHALSSLRRNLFSLARSLPSGLLDAARETIGIRRQNWLNVDVDEFQENLAIVKNHHHSSHRVCPECLPSLKKAAAIYKGDFLEGFNLKDCPGFDDWQFFQRESLRSEYADVLEKLTAYYQEKCEWEQAIRYARSWLALDRLNEPIQRMLITLYNQSGQRRLALTQYELLIDLLQNELGQVPEAETRALYQNMLSAEASGGEKIRPELSQSSSQGPEPLIKTKLFIPPLRVDRVARPQLLDMLDSGSQRPLTLVSAPAGFGKTTLLASWAAHSKLPIAWISIDEGDNDPIRFLHYLIAALESVLPPEVSKQFQTFTQKLQPSIQPTLIRLINQLVEESEPFVLILDDYQFIHSPDVHKALEFIVERIPASMHLVIATRSDPPISLARLRARDQLVEIRVGDLRFSLQESIDFLQQVMSLKLSNADISSLEERTEGWIAGLQMAALAIRTMTAQPDGAVKSRDSEQGISRFIQVFSGSHRYILDYLVEEVLSRHSQKVRSFLMQTSILQRFTGPLCDAVAEIENSQEILIALEKENLFLVPLDGERRWYRYHHLFADLLRFKLEENLSKGSEAESIRMASLEDLHLRAANWLETNQVFGEAVRHYTAARKFDQAAVLIEGQAYPMLFSSGQTYTLLEWLTELPVDLYRSRLRLNIIKAWALISQSQFSAAKAQLEMTGQVVQQRQDAERSSLTGEIALIRGVLAELSTRGVPEMREQALLAWEKLPPDNAMLRGLAAWLLGASYYWEGDTHHAEQYFLQAVHLNREAENTYFTLLSIVDLSNALREQGRVREAYHLLLQTEQELSSKSNQLHPELGHLCINLSQISLQWNDLETAERQLKLGIDLVEQDIPGEILIFGMAVLPYLKLAQGKQAEALRLANECLERAASYPLPYVLAYIKATLIRFWIKVGEQDRIKEWLDSCGLTTDDPIQYVHEVEYTALVKVLIWQGKSEEALKVLAKIIELDQREGRNGKLFYVLALQALAYQQTKNIEQALETLAGSLRLAKSEGIIRPYVDEGKPIEDLLRLGAAQGVWYRNNLDGFVNRLLNAIQQDQDSKGSTHQKFPVSAPEREQTTDGPIRKGN